MKPVTAFIAAGVLGLIALAGTQSAHGAESGDRVPAGWEPPPGATVVSVPQGGSLSFPVRGASWKANGQELVLWWDPTDPETFLAMQSVGRLPNGNENVAMLAMGKTANSKKLFNLMKQLVT